MLIVNDDNLSIELCQRHYVEVHFEPGDLTHYHFFVTKETDDDYIIYPGLQSSFIFPQRMSKFQAIDIVKLNTPENNFTCIEIAEKYNSNVHTVFQVAKIINKLTVKDSEYVVNSRPT